MKPLYVQDNGKYVIVVDTDRQFWRFKKKKGIKIVPLKEGGYKKCKKKKL